MTKPLDFGQIYVKLGEESGEFSKKGVFLDEKPSKSLQTRQKR